MPSASEHALPWMELEEELRSTPPESWLQLGPKARPNLLNQRRILIGRFASATELARALAHADAPTETWRAEAQLYVPGLPEQATPCRRIQLDVPDLWLDLHAGEAPGSRPIVVGLTGNWGMLMSPAAYMSEALQRLGFDLLLVRRRWKGGYLTGGRGDWLTQIGAGEWHRLATPRAVLGTSAGGVPALVLAERLGAARALAICPTATAAVFARGGPVRRLRRWHRLGAGPAMLVLYPSDHEPDREAAELTARSYSALRLPPARIEVLGQAGCRQHNLIRTLVRRGRSLPDLLAEWLRVA